MTNAQTEARAIAALFDDIYVRDGFCDWADVANARDEALRLHATTIQTLSARNAALEAENERLREAIDYYEIGCTAVGVPHAGERKVLHDCVEAARSIRAALSAPKGGQDA